MNRTEPVSTIMSVKPRTVGVDQPIGDVRKLMANGQFHHVPVVRGKRLVGMISATDMNRASYEYSTMDGGRTTVLDQTRSVTELMQQGLVTVKPTDTIHHATEILAKDWFHALPVVDDDDQLVGIVTTTDILRYVLDHD
jgi:CBS domain-containing protein